MAFDFPTHPFLVVAEDWVAIGGVREIVCPVSSLRETTQRPIDAQRQHFARNIRRHFKISKKSDSRLYKRRSMESRTTHRIKAVSTATIGYCSIQRGSSLSNEGPSGLLLMMASKVGLWQLTSKVQLSKINVENIHSTDHWTKDSAFYPKITRLQSSVP